MLAPCARPGIRLVLLSRVDLLVKLLYFAYFGQSVKSATLKCLILLFLLFSCISFIFLIGIGSFCINFTKSTLCKG